MPQIRAPRLAFNWDKGCFGHASTAVSRPPTPTSGSLCEKKSCEQLSKSLIDRVRPRVVRGWGGDFKVAYLMTEYDPTHIYGVETNIGTLANTRLSCIHTPYPQMFTPRFEAVNLGVFVMITTALEPCFSVSVLHTQSHDTM